MNNSDIKTLLKVILVCILLFLASPFIFSFLGFVFKVIIWIILAIIIIVALSIIYFRYKVNKELKEEGFMDNETYSDRDETEGPVDDDDIDYGDSPIVDVYDYKEDKDHETKDN